MTTLTTPPLAELLNEVFAEVEPADEKVRAQFEAIPPSERGRLIAEMKDYKNFYTQMKDAPLAVSRETANLLYMLARTSDAHNIVEFGTSFGVSTLHLAAALKDNGGGKLIGTEFEPGKVEKAKQNVEQGGLADLVEIRAGEALETLAHDLPQSIDMVLLDGAKHLYLPILALLEPHLKKGAVIIADNANMAPDYLNKVRSANDDYMSVPFCQDVELSIRIS